MQTAEYAPILETKSSSPACKSAAKVVGFSPAHVDSSSGGGCVKDDGGNLVLVKDQDENCYITSLINSKKHKVPVGLIIGY